MNGEVCCILGVCCPPNSPEPAAALAKEMVKDGVFKNSGLHVSADEPLSEQQCAERAASWVLKHFDLADAGTLKPFVASIAKHARHAKP